MEWLDRMNDAIGYIEAHLTEKVDLEQAARIAMSSLSRFQRMFTFVTDIPVSEYIRNRRMTLAAEELANGDIKVIDVALRYGYESPEAFTRAFQAFHGIPPSSARKLGIRSSCPRLSFHIKMNGGNINMGTKPLVRIEEHAGERVASFGADCTGPEGVAFDRLRTWAMANLKDWPARRYVGYAPKGHHPEGEAHRPDEGDGRHEYLAQVFLYGHEGDCGTFLGASVKDAPAGLYLVGDVVMNEFRSDGTIDIGSSMQKSAGVMFECLREMGGYELDLQSRPYYEEHIFTEDWSQKDGDLAGFKLWLPIRKADLCEGRA